MKKYKFTAYKNQVGYTLAETIAADSPEAACLALSQIEAHGHTYDVRGWKLDATADGGAMLTPHDDTDMCIVADEVPQ